MIITVDFETYYDKEYSLSKLTTEAYVRDDRFEVIGVGIKEDDNETIWVTGTKEEIRKHLRAYNWKENFILAHNTLFDGAILSWHFGITPKGWLDTLCMARALHGVDAGGSLKALAERYNIGVKGDEVTNALGKRRVDFTVDELATYGAYCCNDVELAYTLFNIFTGGGGFPPQELRVIDATLRMFIDPELELDTAKLEKHLVSVKAHKEELLEKANSDRTTLMSNEKFAAMLQSLNVDPPKKVSARTGKEAWAFAKTDEEFKKLADHEDYRVQALVAARLGTKTTIEETRTQRFIDISKRGKLPVPLKYYGARTGRWAACVVADTLITVYDVSKGVVDKRIVDVLADDLIWDGEAFVTHGGVVFNGYEEVITYDGITGTADHIVFTKDGSKSLSEAMQGSHRIKASPSPTENDVDAAKLITGKFKS